MKTPAERRKPSLRFPLVFSWCFVLLAGAPRAAQVEIVETSPQQTSWVSHGSAEGHLALDYSPAGAFSPDGSQLAVVSGGDVALMDLRGQGISKVLHPHVSGLASLDIESANFLSPGELFILATGEVASRAKGVGARTPELAIRWDVNKDGLIGKVQTVNPKGEFTPPRWFPDIRYLGMSKQNTFELWNPATGKGGSVVVEPLTRPANLFAFSPDGHWMLLAQIESSSQADPIVVGRPSNQFESALKGHAGAVLSMAFARDSSKVVTGCADGRVRIFSASGWNLEHTLEGHEGAVHWAEFSPDGRWIVSAGEDKTVRVWSADSGELLRTLKESTEPVLSAAFSPNNQYIAASAAQKVLVWQRSPGP